MRQLFAGVFCIIWIAALILGGYKAIQYLMVQSQGPSLNALDPWERADAARQAALKYGGGK